MISHNAIVAVSPMVYSFVANDPYAYPMAVGMNLSRLPFDAANGTKYAVYATHGGNLTGFLGSDVFNTTVFGIRAWIPTTYIGSVWLLQARYNGPVQILGSTTLGTGGTYAAGNGLAPGPNGTLKSNTTSLSGTVISTAGNATAKEVGTVFSGPGVSLAAGTYTISLDLSGNQVATNKAANNSTVVAIHISGEWAGLHQVIILSTLIYGSAIPTDNWTSVNLTLTLPYPVLNFGITGINQRSWFGFQVNYVSIAPVPAT
jgi:hypothetical protein